jgi:hypothetical protein
MKRHIVRAAAAGFAAAAIAGLAGITGCGNKPSPQNVQSAGGAPVVQPQAPVAQSTEPATQPAPPVITDVAAGTPEALKFKLERWTKEVEPLMGKRSSGSSSRKGGEPSAADFLEPDDFRIGPASHETPKAAPETQVQVVPVSNPVVESTPSVPNQGASLASQQALARAGGLDGAANVGRIRLDPANERRDAATAVRDTSPNGGDVEAGVAKNLKDNGRELWAQLDYQLLQFLKDKPTPQLDVMAKLSNEDRELIASVMDALTNFRNALRADNNMLMSRKVRPILDLADRVRAQADLVIPTLALCTKVDGFGIYEPIEPARFTAMKPHEIIVYCEVENFASQQNEKKMWETKLSQEVVLYTETGLPVWQDKTESIPDLARNRRHDFFVVKKTKFPPNITLGRYLLKVTIVDQQASRVAEATVPVQFVAQ